MKKQSARILIVDDDNDICEIISHLVKKEGFETFVAHDGDTALKMLASEKPDMLLTDNKMPGMDGKELLKHAKDMDCDLPVVMITAYADVSGAVEAMREGAHDYLAKPFDNHEVIRVVRRALAELELKQKIRDLSSRLEGNDYLRQMMGPSDAIGRLISEVSRVAESDFSVIISGETGSGKELVARAIHQTSSRAKAPFIPVDCGAIPETLFESELFGHEKGAFTGADILKHGKFEAARSGTLFLDEITNMPVPSQAKLLRVIQEKKLTRVGSTKSLDVDVRLLAASNMDLKNQVASGSFREDLFFRLNDFTIKIPPLRERQDDIPYLAKRFLDITNRELNKNVKKFSGPAMEVLLAYNWPGNVRQFISTIRRAVLLADEVITRQHLDLKSYPEPVMEFTAKTERIPWKGLSLKDVVQRSTKAVEREVLKEVLKHTGGNKAKAARMLKIDYKTIHTKVKKLGIPT